MCRSSTGTSARRASRALFRLIGELGKPTICAANGHVLAGALGIALACDLMIAKEEATFGTPEINVGAFPFMIMALIYRNVPRKKTNELLLLGERIDAREAERIGIVNRVVPADEFDAAVAEWAAKLASKSPLIMRLGKDAMFRQQDMAFADALDYLRVAAEPGDDDRGHRRGRDRVLREARTEVERTLMEETRFDAESSEVDSAGEPRTGRWTSSSSTSSTSSRSWASDPAGEHPRARRPPRRSPSTARRAG